MASTLEDITYVIGPQESMYHHAAFTVIAPTQAMIDLCGGSAVGTGVTYTMTTDVVPADVVTYDPSLMRITVSTEDMSLASFGNLSTITITGALTSEPSLTASVTASLDLQTPCNMPTITPQVVTNCDTNYDYPANWKFPITIVDPPVCTQKSFTCEYVSGPYQGDLLDNCDH